MYVNHAPTHARTHTIHTHTCIHTIYHTLILALYYTTLRIEVFHKILLQYTYVALFRDKTDGSLRGMTLIGIDREVVEGKNYTVIKVWLDHVIAASCDHYSHQQSGLVLFKNAYHGGPMIVLLMVYYFIKGLYNE